MNRMYGAVGSAILLAAVLPALGQSQDLGRDATVWTWNASMERGRWFRLSTVNGPVTVEASTDGRVHVRAEKVVRRGRASDVRFRVIESGGDVTVCALWREGETCDENGSKSRGDNSDRDDDRDIQVRFTVRIPSGVRLSAVTVNGEMKVRGATSEVRASSVNGGVEVRDAGGEVKATTVNGNVDVTTRSGPVNATTVNGSIDVRMASVGAGGNMRFNTVNGNITVKTPASLNADVSLQTMHGSLSSDYPVQISGRFGPRHADGKVGNGGPALSMRSLNGSVELRKAM